MITYHAQSSWLIEMYILVWKIVKINGLIYFSAGCIMDNLRRIHHDDLQLQSIFFLSLGIRDANPCKKIRKLS